VAECGAPPVGLWPTAVEQGKVAGTNAAGGDLRYLPPPARTVLKGVGIAVQSAGRLEPAPGDEVEVSDAGEDDVRYRKVIRRGSAVVGAVYLGDWPDAEEVCGAVTPPLPQQAAERATVGA
jgi:nitrite reductase (NADH) large subunit